MEVTEGLAPDMSGRGKGRFGSSLLNGESELRSSSEEGAAVEVTMVTVLAFAASLEETVRK